jgi:hypothetical protein
MFSDDVGTLSCHNSWLEHRLLQMTSSVEWLYWNVDAVVLFAWNHCMCSLKIRNNAIPVTLPAFLTDIMLHDTCVCGPICCISHTAFYWPEHFNGKNSYPDHKMKATNTHPGRDWGKNQLATTSFLFQSLVKWPRHYGTNKISFELSLLCPK